MMKFLILLFAFLALAISSGLAGLLPSPDMIMDVTDKWDEVTTEDSWRII